MASFSVYYRQNRCAEITLKGNSYKFYRIPFALLDSGKHNVKPDCNFIVYLLSGRNSDGEDCLYVGTSTDGLEGRPTSHEDKKVAWKDCFVFTAFDPSLLNASIILELENRIKKRIDECSRYVNKTELTTGKAANAEEKEICDSIFPSMIQFYDLMGVDLTPAYSIPTLDGLISQKGSAPIKTADYSPLNLPAEMQSWFESSEIILRSLDPELIGNVTSAYANYKYRGVTKTLAYFYPKKSKRQIQVLLQGTPDWYGDARVTDRPDNMHNGDCKAMFFINCADDLDYLKLFAEKALKKMNRL